MCTSFTGRKDELEAVKQSDGEWITAFSMVYSQKENAVYYCFNGDFKNILRHSFVM